MIIIGFFFHFETVKKALRSITGMKVLYYNQDRNISTEKYRVPLIKGHALNIGQPFKQVP